MRSVSVDAELTAAPKLSSAANNNNQPPQSVWHTPVPFLFGGLAAMIGLIVVALVILACSYISYSIRGVVAGDEGEDEKESGSGVKSTNASYDEKVLVIMAGEDLPTYLATPAAKRCVCQEGKVDIAEDDGGGDTIGDEEKVKEHEEASH